VTGPLTAGFAKVDITPQPGIHLGGYWGRTSGAVDVRDPLWARALVLGAGAGRVGLVALDLVGLDAATAMRMRQAAAAASGIGPDQLMVCCTHTHAGPLTLSFRGMGEMDTAYVRSLIDTVAGVVATACEDGAPARLAYARPQVQLGANRQQKVGGEVILGRDPDGPVVPYAHVVHLDRAGCPDIVLCSHPCHPVVLGSANHSISADFPGAAVRAVERRTNSHALFVNGACGDINPRLTRGTPADVDELGEELAAAVVGGLGEATSWPVDRVAGTRHGAELPLVDPPSVARAGAIRAWLKLRAAAIRCRRGGGYWARLVPQARVQWARDLLALSRTGARGLRQDFEVQGIAVGPLALVGMEGEMFARYQLELEAGSPVQPTVLVGYANGCVGYVPTADEFDRGGYEVGSGYRIAQGRGVDAYQVYPTVQMLSSECDGTVRDAARTVLARLAAQ